MIHVGVDLHQRFCYMTALEARGEMVQAGPVTNEKLALRRYFRQFRGKEVQVAVEACGFWPAFREVVEPEVARLVLVHPQRVKAIASAKRKKDRVDSETLAHLLRCDLLPESWKADRGTQARRQQVRLRATLVRHRTRLKNQVHAAASAGAALSGDGFIRPTRTEVAGGGETAGAGAGSGAGVLALAGRLQRRNSKTKPPTKGKSGTRPARAVVEDDSGDWRVFGDDAAGRDRRDRTISRQRSVVQLRRAGTASARVGGQGSARWHHTAGFALDALDHGGSRPGGDALFSRRPALL